MDQFAGQAVGQKPGKQWRGDDPNPPGKKLVGDSIIKDLSKGPTPKTKEQELAEEWAVFSEEDLGTHPKRAGRKSDRHTRGHEPQPRYKTVKANEGWNTGSDRVSLPDEPHTYWSGTGALQKEYDALYEKLVPAQGAAETIEGEVLRAASKIVYRHFNDGDEFNRASYRQLEQYIGPVTSYDDLAHKATEFALKANGNYHPNQGWDSLDVMDYGPAEEEEYDDEDDDYDDWSDDVDNEEDDEVDEGMEEFAKSQAKQRAAKRKSIPWPKEVPSDASQEQDDEDEPHPYGHDLDEGAADVYSITSERNGRERSKSGTLAELIEYYGYTLETGKSYEHERGNSKINLNPKSIESLVQNLNNAKSNAAANGQSNERFYIDHGNMAEGRGPGKGLHKKVTVVKGRDAGKTGYVRQIKTDKLRNRVYLDLDLEDGGQAVVLKQDVRLVKEVAEARTTWNNDFYVYDPKTKTVKKKFRTHKGAKQYAEANGLKVASAEYYHDSVSKDVAEATGDPKFDAMLKGITGKKQVAKQQKTDSKQQARGAFDGMFGGGNPADKLSIRKKGVAEGWESGPEEHEEPYDDADDAYDRQRQEKIDTEAEKEWAKLPKVSTYKLIGRGPNMEPNYEFGDEFDTMEQAVEYRAEIMKDPKTPHPEHIGIRTLTRVKDQTNEAVMGGGGVKDIDDYITKRDYIYQQLANPKQVDNYPHFKQALFDLMRTAREKGIKIEESKAHKDLATWFQNREIAQNFATGKSKIPTPQERNVKIEKPKKQVKEYGANNPPQGSTTLQKVDPKQAQAVAQATSALKSATQSSAPAPMIAKALDAASQGKPVGQQDMKAIEPIMKDIATVAQDPKLAGQFKSLAQQIQQTQLKQK